jgi:hypothetical protein
VEFFVPRKYAVEKYLLGINIILRKLYLISTPGNTSSVRVQGVSF